MLRTRRPGTGLGMAGLSAAAFSTSGPLGRSLTAAGWSPGAVVATRLGAAAALLAVPAVLSLRGRWRALWRKAGLVAAYGLVALAGCQVSFFNAIQHLPVALASAGMGLGAIALASLGAAGALPMHGAFGTVDLAGHRTSWFVPAAGLAVVATAAADVTGIAAARALGARRASFAALSEVVFAVLAAWLLLGQRPAVTQVAGGILILAGVAAVHTDTPRPATRRAWSSRRPCPCGEPRPAARS